MKSYPPVDDGSEAPKRSLFGVGVKVLFWLFNLLMLVVATALFLELIGPAPQNDAALVTLILKIIFGLILLFWFLGDLVLGALMLFTKPEKPPVLQDESESGDEVVDPEDEKSDLPQASEKSQAKTLQALGLAYYLLAGLLAILSLSGIFPALVKFIGIVASSDNKIETIIQFVCLFSIALIPMAVGFILAIFFVICLFHLGSLLQRQKHHSRCLVLAGLSCLLIPFGTLLGLITLIFLARPSGKEAFAEQSIA